MTNVNSNILFIASLHSISPESYGHLAQPVSHLARIAANRLLIVLVSPQFHSGGGDNTNQDADVRDGNGACHSEDSTTRMRFEQVNQEADKGDKEKDAISDLEESPIHWRAIQRLLTFVYVQASKIASEQNNILLQIDVLLKSPNELRALELPFTPAHPTGSGVNVTQPPLQGEEPEFEVMYRLNGDDLELSRALARIPQRTLSNVTPAAIQNSDGPPRRDISSQEQSNTSRQGASSRFPVIALGGTFDHLHAGHKILLSVAAWLASRKLIAGVTDTSLLGSKTHPELLESLDVRISRTREFLTLFKPSLEYDVVPIKDVYGPTGWDADIQALVVSRETLGGAKSIATHRAAHNLPPLQTFVIDVISHLDENIVLEDAADLRKAKMSSTAIREWIAARR
jgi:pantetheine-phosphate adenylyltransferase